MFPLNESNFEIERAKTHSTTIGRTFYFDFDSGMFELTDGKVAEIDNEEEKAKQWIELFLRTVPVKYKVYEDALMYGVNTTELIGLRQVPAGFIYSELKREVEEGLTLNPAIDYIAEFAAKRNDNKMHVSFTVHLKNGSRTEVSIVV